VSELSELQLGQQRAPVHAAAEETHPYIRAANIKWTGLDLVDVKRMGFPDVERYLLKPGDVLLSEASGSATEVGKPAIWRGEIPGCCYQKTLLRARPASDQVLSEWLHLSFLADALLGRFARMAPGVGILHLTADRMLSWPIPFPPRQEQEAILGITTMSLGEVATQERMIGTLRDHALHLDSAILAKAFRGELVPQDPNDEPADAMLARLARAGESGASA
jgi:type I restriction enzyme S subunit